jgi:hypothetical protein
MSNKDSKGDKTGATHTTHIGTVTGQVHTGSGDIIVHSFSSGTVSTKDAFLAALREFKVELDASRRLGLPEETADDVVAEVEAAEREAGKEAPKAGRITKRLEQAKSILEASTGAASALSGAAAAAGKLLPQINSAIQTVSSIFQ